MSILEFFNENTIDGRSNRLNQEPGLLVMKYPSYFLPVLLFGIVFLLGFLAFGYLQKDKAFGVFSFLFVMVIVLICVYGVIEYYRVWHVISKDGMDFGRVFKPRVYLAWSEVAKVSYCPRKFRLFKPRWFCLESQDGKAIRVSDDFAGIQNFSRLVLAYISPDVIEPQALSVLRAIEDGWRRGNGDKWRNASAPKVPELPVTRIRTIAGYAVGFGILPVLFLLLIAFSSKPEAAFIQTFELHFVWPCIAVSGLLGFPLFRIQRRGYLFLAMLVLGALSGAIIAYVAQLFYHQFSGLELRLAKSLITQGLFCFGCFVSVAIPPSTNLKKLM